MAEHAAHEAQAEHAVSRQTAGQGGAAQDIGPGGRDLLRLQRTAGNRAVGGLVRASGATVQRSTSGGGDAGLPEPLQTGIESLSGVAVDDVQVQYDSPEPARYGAHAFAEGDSIHLGPGSESSLPHEAWHVVQQKQGRVPTEFQMNDSPVNADAALEHEADTKGRQAAEVGSSPATRAPVRSSLAAVSGAISRVKQMDWWEKVGDAIIKRTGTKPGGYRMVKGVRSPTNEPVFETQEQRKTHVEQPKTYADELGVLPTSGEFTVPSHLVRYSQDSISKTFTNGTTINDTVALLKKGTLSASSFPAIRVFESSSGRLVTLDNRRLWCCKEVGADVKCTWATKEAVESEAYKFTSNQGKDGLTTIEVRG